MTRKAPRTHRIPRLPRLARLAGVLALGLAAALAAGASAELAAQESPEVAAAPAAGEARYELLYTGEFIDQESEPISAVFPLEFKLYPTDTSRKVLWQESHFVSVVDGSYTIALGTRTPLPEIATRETVFLAVELDGLEVVRQPMRARLVSDQVRVGAVASSGTADWAERAGDAETLGGFGPDDFARVTQLTALERQVQTLKSETGKPAAAAGSGSGGGGYLGGTNWQSQYAGGSGGKDFNLSCPEGYVMTGIQGRSGAVIDALRIVCQKLE